MAKKPPTICYNPAHAMASLPRRRVRWIEHASKGLRVVDYADKILRLDHHGWYTAPEPFQDDVARGAVLRLTRAAGAERFLAAIEDPWNTDCYIVNMERFDEADDAAREADRMAEAYAEAERDYRTRDAAACMIESDKEGIALARAEASKLIAEMRSMRELRRDVPAICHALRVAIGGHRRQVRAYISEIRKLREDPYAWLS